jgi:hypothetical protein
MVSATNRPYRSIGHRRCRTSRSYISVEVTVHGFLGGWGAGPEEVDRDGNRNLINAAVRQRVDRFVLVSVMSAAHDHPMNLHRMKYAAEQSLRATGLAWTIVRPSAYLQTWTDVIGGKLAGGGQAMVFGRGENPINFVSARDVAAVIATILPDPSHLGAIVDVPGLPAGQSCTRAAGFHRPDHGHHRHDRRPHSRLPAVPRPGAGATRRRRHSHAV